MSEAAITFLHNGQPATDQEWPFCKICVDEDGLPTRHAPYQQIRKDLAQQLLQQYDASGGLQLNSDGEFEKLSMERFAHMIGWTRPTLYNWRDSDPLWDQKVLQLIPKVNGARRVARVFRGVFVQAAAGKDRQAELFLRHFYPDYKSPTAEVKHDISGFTDVVKAAIQEGIIVDGEYIDPNADSAGSSEDHSALPGQS